MVRFNGREGRPQKATGQFVHQILCLSYPSGGAPLISGHYVSWQLGRLIVEIGEPEDTCQPTNIVVCFTHRPRMEKSHSKHHKLVDCPLFTIAR